MTPEQQRIAVAEACGWKRCVHVTDARDGCNGENSRGLYTVLPDYLNDLNAMHEAEKMLENPDLYEEWLESLYDGKSYLFHATAAQRAEAFLRTLNLWKD